MSDIKRETLPLWQWFSVEARYFLAEPEERETIIVRIHDEFGQFGEQILREWANYD